VEYQILRHTVGKRLQELKPLIIQHSKIISFNISDNICAINICSFDCGHEMNWLSCDAAGWTEQRQNVNVSFDANVWPHEQKMIQGCLQSRSNILHRIRADVAVDNEDTCVRHHANGLKLRLIGLR
jgi:hypothetical protein